MGATTLVLLELDVESVRDLVRSLRQISRSELLPAVSRSWLHDAADLAAHSLLVASMRLQELREKHPAEASAAGAISAELEAELEAEASRLTGQLTARANEGLSAGGGS